MKCVVLFVLFLSCDWINGNMLVVINMNFVLLFNFGFWCKILIIFFLVVICNLGFLLFFIELSKRLEFFILFLWVKNLILYMVILLVGFFFIYFL